MALVYLLLISSCLLQWSDAFTPVVYDAEILSQCDQSDPFRNDQRLMRKLNRRSGEDMTKKKAFESRGRKFSMTIYLSVSRKCAVDNTD